MNAPANFAFNRRTECPACGSAELALIYKAPFRSPIWSRFLSDYYRQPIDLPGNYEVARCRRCETLFQVEIGNDALLAALYGHWIKAPWPEDNPTYLWDVAHPHLSRDGHEIMAAASYLGVPLDQLVTLDYGMGWAPWARAAKGLGARAYGFDLSEERRAFAQSHGVDLDDGTARFHFINTEQLMEHVANPAALVGELTARLLPGGIFKISVPAQHKVGDVLDRIIKGQASVTRAEIMPVQPLEHVNCFTAAGLSALGERYGLRVVRSSFRHRFAFLPGGVDPRYPRKAVKELVRPFVQWRRPTKLYAWLRKAS